MDADGTDKTCESQLEHGLDNPVHEEEEGLSSAPTANVGEASGKKGSLENHECLKFSQSQGSLMGQWLSSVQTQT